MLFASGTFDGTGATIYVGIGFKPKAVTLWNVTEASNFLQYGVWNTGMYGLAACQGGKKMVFDDDTAGDADSLAFGSGVSIYEGGTVGLNTEVYLIKDPSPDKRNAGSTPITTWTLGSSSNKTGNVNAACTVTAPNIVGVGSTIYIDGGQGAKKYTILAFTNYGEAANYITLDVAAPSGTVTFLGGRFSYVQCPTSLIMPAGFALAADAALNADSEMMYFEAIG